MKRKCRVYNYVAHIMNELPSIYNSLITIQSRQQSCKVWNSLAWRLHFDSPSSWNGKKEMYEVRIKKWRELWIIIWSFWFISCGFSLVGCMGLRLDGADQPFDRQHHCKATNVQYNQRNMPLNVHYNLQFVLRSCTVRFGQKTPVGILNGFR